MWAASMWEARGERQNMVTLSVGEVKEEDGFHGDSVGEVNLSLRFFVNEMRVATVAILGSVSGGVNVYPIMSMSS